MTALALGIVGSPLGHSASPALHRLLGALAGVEVRYERYEVARADDLPAALARLARAGVRGLNVTIPHKVAVLALARRVTDVARAVGAANTLTLDAQGVVEAHNTDVEGLLGALAEAGVDLAGRRALVLGAGGAARAAVYALLRAGAIVELTCRRPEAALDLVAVTASLGFPLAVTPWSDRALRAQDATLIVNATSVGMEGSPSSGASPLPADTALGAEHVVLDMVYRPLETPLLAQARAAGATPIDGLGMLIHQGLAAFTRFSGHPLTLDPQSHRHLRATLSPPVQ